MNRISSTAIRTIATATQGRRWNAAVCSGISLLLWLAFVTSASAQTRPYIGFVYPAGGQQGTTVRVRVGGQGLDGVDRALITGTGIKVRVVDYQRRLSPQDMTLLREQLKDLKQTGKCPPPPAAEQQEREEIRGRVEQRIAGFVNRPACASIANVTVLEITISPNARPGERELRLETATGISNPMAFHVGQLSEFTHPPLGTCEAQVLGKEEQALRGRAAQEPPLKLKPPAIVNGQIAPGEVDRHRFTARRGQRLVIAVLARQLVPYIADAVPGWFQPVLTLRDAAGRELACVDDFRFKPDPVLFHDITADGEYEFTLHDSLFRGREDFVYRVTVGELPYVTSVFPLGVAQGAPVELALQGVNLAGAELKPPPRGAEPGIHQLTPTQGTNALNRVPFAVDTLPELLEREPNDPGGAPQSVTLPVVINGRVDRPDDWDVFEFEGRAGQDVVAEVLARRLDSPLDSILKLTDASGKVLATNDDRDDPATGLNTHHADSYLTVKLPADGRYRVHLGDTTRAGSSEHAYRLWLSAPRPDFALRVVPSSVSLRNRSSATVSVHLIRRDGFTSPVTVHLANVVPGLAAVPVALVGTQQVVQLTLQANWASMREPVCLTPSVAGSARIGGRAVTHPATPAEDRMQAFLWRHLVPASDLRVHVYSPSYQTPPRHGTGITHAEVASARVAVAKKAEEPPAFSKSQAAARVRELRRLHEEGLLTDDFYLQKVMECQVVD